MTFNTGKKTRKACSFVLFATTIQMSSENNGTNVTQYILGRKRNYIWRPYFFSQTLCSDSIDIQDGSLRAHSRWSNHPLSWCGRCWAGCCNAGGPSLPSLSWGHHDKKVKWAVFSSPLSRFVCFYMTKWMSHTNVRSLAPHLTWHGRRLCCTIVCCTSEHWYSLFTCVHA